MAKVTRKVERAAINPPHKTTSIGRSVNTRQTNKRAPAQKQKYRGQG